jgi:hypothetical protein
VGAADAVTGGAAVSIGAGAAEGGGAAEATPLGSLAGSSPPQAQREWTAITPTSRASFFIVFPFSAVLHTRGRAGILAGFRVGKGGQRALPLYQRDTNATR